MNRLAALGCLSFCSLVLTACPKSGEGDKAAPAASTSAAASATTAVAPAASSSAPAAAGSGTPAGKSSALAGTYSLAPAAYYIPESKDYGSVKQVKDDPSKHVGDGAIEVAVAPDGKVTGTLEGAAGPALIDGSMADGELRGVVRRKDPKDNGLTGMLVAKLTGATGEGKLSLADATTAIVREGKVTLKQK